MIRRVAILVLAFASAAFAADDTSSYYFDNGAEQYTRNEIETAKKWVAEGLELYPGDKNLLALKQLIEQQQQQNQQNQQQQDQQQQQQQQDQQNQQNQDNSQAQQDQGDDEQQQQAEAQQQNAGDDKEDKGKDEQQVRAMTQEEAERILDAMRERESSDRAKIAEDRIRQEMGRLPMVEKDW